MSQFLHHFVFRMASGIECSYHLNRIYIVFIFSSYLVCVLSSSSSSSQPSSSTSHKNLNYERMKSKGTITNKVTDDSQHHHHHNHDIMQNDDMMDSKFDFHFNWDEEPPEFISQLDLEVKWEDEEDSSKAKKVSIHNVTMNQDYDITVPMTKLISSIANNSINEDVKNMLATSTSNPINQNQSNSISEMEMCACSEIHSIIKDLQNAVKGDIGQRKEGRKGRGRKRSKGDKGQKGEPGLSIVGPKGEPGDSGLLPYHLMRPDTSRLKGEPGPRGPPGPPGTCSASCPNSNSMPPPESLHNPRRERTTFTSSKPHHYRIVPGALVFQSRPRMFQMSTYVMIGSVVFVEDSEEFYGKVKGGWRKFQMGPLEGN